MTPRQFFAIVEIRTKIVSVSTFLLASLYVYSRTGQLDPLRTILMFIATVLVDMGTTGFNTYFDFRRGVDNSAYNREENKVVVHEGVPWGWALVSSLSLFMLAVPFGITLAVLSGWPVVLIGAACMAVGFFYTGGPLPISRTPLGEVFAGGTLGTVLFVLVWYIQSGTPDGRVLLASLPSTLMIAAILTTNNTCDIEGDRAAGRKTLSVLLGRAGGEAVLVSEVHAGFLMLCAAVLFGFAPFWALAPILVILVPVSLELIAMHRRGFSHGTKEASMGGISKIFLLFTLAAAILLVVNIVT